MKQWLDSLIEHLVFVYRLYTGRDLETGKKEKTNETD